MYHYGARGQRNRDPLFDASGTIVSATAPQLVLPERPSCTYLTIQNNSDNDLWLEFGCARATCAVSGGVITGFTITNGGFGFTYPPDVILKGGGYEGNTTRLAVGLEGYPAPGQSGDPSGYHPGTAYAVLTAGVVTSIAIEDPGAGYGVAPQVFLQNRTRRGVVLDPYGCADPSIAVGSVFSGLRMFGPGGGFGIENTFNTTDAIAIFGQTVGQQFTVKWAP